ncbi:hypothetical protein CANCADRAFT_109937 [Tortispora caseinolytica NRRL Y-17796]|uniref:UBC core domain-containing protein n=1 Tax=Tortispora caseinolytica NRRL Y-17796 TaxID=767744 RepID=A0A1E4TG18_9ASCO|nr:hypothetical protein CANCADRAFT_109937 [Tortispora caseinolytica NRRL Y-17796]
MFWPLIEQEIRVELANLGSHNPSGVYVIANHDNLYLLDGVIFVHSGPYKGGIFHFQIHLPDDYGSVDSAAPRVKFKSHIPSHPRIDASGDLDLTLLLSKHQTGPSIDDPIDWLQSKKRIYIHTLCKFIKASFKSDLLNAAPGSLYTIDRDRFETLAKADVEASIAALPESPSDLFQFNALDEQQCKQLEELLAAHENLTSMAP